MRHSGFVGPGRHLSSGAAVACPPTWTGPALAAPRVLARPLRRVLSDYPSDEPEPQNHATTQPTPSARLAPTARLRSLELHRPRASPFIPTAWGEHQYRAPWPPQRPASRAARLPAPAQLQVLELHVEVDAQALTVAVAIFTGASAFDDHINLSLPTRRAILEILLDTKPKLPEGWRGVRQP